jgi:hypothetical protein
MKKGILACAIASAVAGSPLSFHIHRFSAVKQSSITGKISPAGEADIVRIIGVSDSLKVSVVSGNFFAEVKPGRYKLIIKTKGPYKDAQLDNLVVKQNQSLNIGEIILQ